MPTNSISHGRRLLAALVITLVAAALFVSAAGAATIHACVKPKSGATRIVGAKAKCHHGEQKLSWSNEGPRGPAGPAGPGGAQGVSGSAGTNGLNGAGPLFAAGSSTQTHIVTSETMLVSKVVPPGSYTIWGKIDILETGNTREGPIFECLLRAHAGTEESDESEGIDDSIFEAPLNEHGAGSFQGATTISLGGTYVSSKTSTLFATCRKEGGGSTTATSLLAQIQALGVTSIG
jgi:hypothetical protein